MKKCTTCGKTFDDNLKFCQTDGTPLVEVVNSGETEESEDPYKTIVGGLDKLPVPPKEDKSDVSGEDDGVDLMQTMVVSPEELRKELDQVEPPSAEPKEMPPPVEMPSPAETPPANVPPPSPFDNPPPDNDFDADIPESVNFDEPDLNPTDFGGSSFDQSPQVQDSSGNAPIPSPFDESMSGYQPPPVPRQTYDELELAEIKAEQLNTPFADEVNRGNQEVEMSDWSPPPAPDANWQNQQIGQNSAFNSPPTGADGNNKTLAIVSLVLGVISIPCCSAFVVGAAAAVTGYLARKNIDENPAEYGGRGMATAGMIIGIITSVLGLILIVLQVLFGILGNLG